MALQTDISSFALTLLVILLGSSSVHCVSYPNFAAYTAAFKSKFSILDKYAKKAGLDVLATNSSLDITLFLPTNAAFSKAVTTYLDGLDKQSLSEVLLAHAAPSVVKSDCIRSGLTVQMFPGRYDRERTVLGDKAIGSGQALIRALYSAAKITKADVPVAKGLVHEIDTVLLFDDALNSGPYYTTILEVAQKFRLKTFATAIDAYKPAADRLDIYDIAQSEGRGTAFGFTDATFDKVLKSCSEPQRLKSNLNRILAYSFTFDVLPLARLANGLKFTTLSFEMEEAVVAPPGEHRVTYKNGAPYITSEYGVFKITQTVHTRYAVLHILDGLLAPSDRDGIC